MIQPLPVRAKYGSTLKAMRMNPELGPECTKTTAILPLICCPRQNEIMYIIPVSST